MEQSREIRCGQHTLLVRVYDDDVIGVFDESGRMILGWPETTVLGGREILQRSEQELCEQLGRLRKLR